MKKSFVLLIVTIGIALILTSSCGKKISVKPTEQTKSEGKSKTNQVEEVTSKIKPSILPNHDVKEINLGLAESFSILAYTSIKSIPPSKITGKIGLKPGRRALLGLDPKIETQGGLAEIFAGDDEGEAQTYITTVHSDVVEFYRDIISRGPDSDKKELYEGKINGQILPAGIYRWSNGLDISNNLILDGNQDDRFIFQVNGNLKINPDVKIILKNGIKAKNVYWAVSGKVLIDQNSLAIGTIVSQLCFEMKKKAQLIGRAFVKNSTLILDQNNIELGETFNF